MAVWEGLLRLERQSAAVAPYGGANKQGLRATAKKNFTEPPVCPRR